MACSGERPQNARKIERGALGKAAVLTRRKFSEGGPSIPGGSAPLGRRNCALIPNSAWGGRGLAKTASCGHRRHRFSSQTLDLKVQRARSKCAKEGLRKILGQNNLSCPSRGTKMTPKNWAQGPRPECHQAALGDRVVRLEARKAEV